MYTWNLSWGFVTTASNSILIETVSFDRNNESWNVIHVLRHIRRQHLSRVINMTVWSTTKCDQTVISCSVIRSVISYRVWSKCDQLQSVINYRVWSKCDELESVNRLIVICFILARISYFLLNYINLFYVYIYSIYCIMYDLSYCVVFNTCILCVIETFAHIKIDDLIFMIPSMALDSLLCWYAVKNQIISINLF